MNVRQLRAVNRGLASITAIANIPMLDVGKRFSIGVGFGGYDGQNAAAIGISTRPTDNIALRASVGKSFSAGSSSDNKTWSVGGAYSW